ncbi:helix-turn-helix domain-containing protein, partial [Clostridium sp. ATCC 29733]
MNKQEFGKRLNDARKKIGMKTETLAEEIDVSVGFLHDIFRGRTYPSVETFVK